MMELIMKRYLTAAVGFGSGLLASLGASAATVSLTVPDTEYAADFSDIYSNIATIGALVIGAIIAIKTFSWLKGVFA